MSDIRTTWRIDRGDWSLSGPALASGGDLFTAVAISLFTDREADPDDVIPDGSGDPRGWWADDPERRIGSRLWLLTRSKRTQETLLRAQDYAQEALQWMLEDGVVAKWDVLVEWTAQNTLGVQVTARRTDGRVEAMNFAWAWAN